MRALWWKSGLPTAGKFLADWRPWSIPDYPEPYEQPRPLGCAANWTASASVGGIPGGEALSHYYDTRQEHQFNAVETADELYSAPEADADSDGISNFLEYLLGGNLEEPTGDELFPLSGFHSSGGEDYLMMEVTTVQRTSGTMTAEISTDLVTWLSDTGAVLPIGEPETNGDGSITTQFRDVIPVGSSESRRFIRARFTE